MLVIDGNDYDDIVVGIKRKAELRASDVSGFLLDGDYFNDVIGTYMSYDVQVAIPKGNEGTYTVLYQTLTDPVESHTFELPYNQGTIEFVGRVNVVSDEYLGDRNGVILWRRITFTVIANEPIRRAGE